MGKPGHVLVIDDDIALLQVLELTLSEKGFAVTCATCGQQGIQRVFEERPDLVVLDIRLPDMDGWEVCRRIREKSNVPVLMLTACQEQEDRIKGLSLGADDYLVKPFDIRELLLRVRAILRRAGASAAKSSEPSSALISLDNGRLDIDLALRHVLKDGQPVHLSPHEYDLLACLAKQPGRVVSPAAILAAVWGLEPSPKTLQYVKTYIRYLRNKIEPDPAHPRYILNARGLGYYLAKR